MIWTDLGILVFVATGFVVGIYWERNRIGGTADLRRERNQLRRHLRAARAAADPARAAAMHNHPSVEHHSTPKSAGRGLYAVRGGRG
ncbi:MAG: hypothetical protein JO222_01395 [Frankiales bacterium]|nr:hypothetical protein [Frankiales bacterium]